jgi:hypothetical protein
MHDGRLRIAVVLQLDRRGDGLAVDTERRIVLQGGFVAGERDVGGDGRRRRQLDVVGPFVQPVEADEREPAVLFQQLVVTGLTPLQLVGVERFGIGGSGRRRGLTAGGENNEDGGEGGEGEEPGFHAALG